MATAEQSYGGNNENKDWGKGTRCGGKPDTWHKPKHNSKGGGRGYGDKKPRQSFTGGFMTLFVVMDDEDVDTCAMPEDLRNYAAQIMFVHCPTVDSTVTMHDKPMHLATHDDGGRGSSMIS